MKEESSSDKRKFNGGARIGAGKKALAEGDKKVTVSFQIKKKFAVKAKLEIQKIVDQINSSKD